MGTEMICSQQHDTSASYEHEDDVMAARLRALRRRPPSALLARVAAIPGAAPDRPLYVRWAWAAAGVTATLLLLALALPTGLRAQAEAIWERMGGVRILVTDRSPDSASATIVEPERMTLEEARARVPYDFGVPVLPEGWSMEPEVAVVDLGAGPEVEMRLMHKDGTALRLHARAAGASALQVGDTQRHGIQVGASDGLLMHGGWDANTREWQHPEVVTLAWATGEAQYELIGFGSGLEDTLVEIGATLP